MGRQSRKRKDNDGCKIAPLHPFLKLTYMKVCEDNLLCLKCGHEASTMREFVTGKCSFCGGELEPDIETEDTERDRGIDPFNF